MPMSTVEIEPRLPEGRVKEWRRRHDSTVKTLTDSGEPAQVVVKRRAEPKPESKEKKPGKNALRRAWDAIPTWVKVVGGAVLAAFLTKYFFQFMSKQHAEIGKRTHEAARGIAGAVNRVAPVAGETGRGAPMGDPGSGSIDNNPNIAGSPGNRLAPRRRGDLPSQPPPGGSQ